MSSCSFFLLTAGSVNSETLTISDGNITFLFLQANALDVLFALNVQGDFTCCLLQNNLVSLRMPLSKLVVRKRKWGKVCRTSNC